MKRKLISVSVITAVATAAISFGIIGTVRAQTDTGIGTNPHLRAQSAPSASPGATDAKMSQKDAKGIQVAAVGGAQEVETGEMAANEGNGAEGGNVAVRMVAQHTRPQ